MRVLLERSFIYITFTPDTIVTLGRAYIKNKYIENDLNKPICKMSRDNINNMRKIIGEKVLIHSRMPHEYWNLKCIEDV